LTTTGLVLDADAVAAYAHGSPRVGREISRVVDDEGDVIVPALCLAEAYRTGNGEKAAYLELLVSLPRVTVIGVEEADCWTIGGWARKIGSLHLAHAVVETAARPVTTLLTAHRDKVTEHLPEEWPIIDL
jgi:hypothetical protein